MLQNRNGGKIILKGRTAFLSLLSSIFLLIFISSSLSNTTEWFGRIQGDEPLVTVDIPIHNENTIKLAFRINGTLLKYIPSMNGYEVAIPGEGNIDIEGKPSLPVVSRLVAVPAQAKVSFRYEYDDVLIKEDIDILPSMQVPLSDIDPNIELTYDNETYNTDRFFPENAAEAGRPVVLRDLRIVRVSVNPARYNPVERILTLYRSIEVTLNFETGGVENILASEPVTISRSFAPIYESLIANYSLLDLEEDEVLGSLLIIAPDNPTVLNIIQPLVEWKKRKGFPTIVADLSQTGSTASQITTYIQDVYDTSEPQLAYLILIGDCAGSVAVPASNPFGDHDYSRLEGDDFLADIAVGRFSCANTTQLMTEVSKVIGYESNPYMGQTEWYKKGAVVAAHQSSGISTIQTKRAIRYKALMNGYTAVDTMWFTMGGSISTFTSNAFNSGIGFYNFRGFIGMTGWNNASTNALVNSFKLPFVVTITCETGDITTSASANSEEFFRVGTPSNPTGAIGAVGTATHGTHTRHNNCLDMGIFSAFYDYGVYGMGDALNNGKYYLYINYPYNPTSVEDFCEWNNLIGDPSCQLWTDIPQTMTVIYQDTIPAGSTNLTIAVVDSASGLPLENVDVCLYGDDIHSFVLTGENGEVEFQLPQQIEGETDVTCCRHNYKPYLGRVVLQIEDIFINYLNVTIDDDNIGQSSGNDDDNINPGETIELGISLKNFGQSLTAANISTALITDDELISLSDSIQTFPDLLPQSVSPVVMPSFVFTVSTEASDDYTLDFDLNITCDQGQWVSGMPLPVAAPDVVYQSHTVIDTNNQIDPGEQVEIVITLVNGGGLSAESLFAELYCLNEYIYILQNAADYGNIGAGQTASDTFLLEASPYTIPGAIIDFEIYLNGDNGYADTTAFELQIGSKVSSDPLGPDEYGYYALDDTDTLYTGCPGYDWVEIDSNVPGYQYPGILLPLSDYGDEQDDTVPINIPFTFTYYGVEYTTIAVCSNGWLAFGEDMAYYTNFRNWNIPNTLGPYAMAAPFWDDLYLINSPPKKVYAYYDADGHRLIIEWNVMNSAPGNPPEKFQVILYDPEYHPTETGDGEILFQYEEVWNVFGIYSDNHFATVGIEDQTSQIGIQYTYWNGYPDGAAVLSDGRAIKFTTNTPVHLGSLNIDDMCISIVQDDVVLNWGEVQDASVYYIYRSDSPYFDIAGMTPYDSTSETEYTDAGVFQNGPFFYKVTWE
ncbi:MAG: hypothetical protein HQ591_03205 [candidate division Zixibacteria bacterium]|nr:hypothetical protein [Candidatus Tariuqbacter arcticus]